MLELGLLSSTLLSFFVAAVVHVVKAGTPIWPFTSPRVNTEPITIAEAQKLFPQLKVVRVHEPEDPSWMEIVGIPINVWCSYAVRCHGPNGFELGQDRLDALIHRRDVLHDFEDLPVKLVKPKSKEITTGQDAATVPGSWLEQRWPRLHTVHGIEWTRFVDKEGDRMIGYCRSCGEKWWFFFETGKSEVIRVSSPMPPMEHEDACGCEQCFEDRVSAHADEMIKALGLPEPIMGRREIETVGFNGSEYMRTAHEWLFQHMSAGHNITEGAIHSYGSRLHDCECGLFMEFNHQHQSVRYSRWQQLVEETMKTVKY